MKAAYKVFTYISGHCPSSYTEVFDKETNELLFTCGTASKSKANKRALKRGYKVEQSFRKLKDGTLEETTQTK